MHKPHKVSQYKKGKDSVHVQGKRRYDRKQAGFGGQTKPVFHKKAKTTKKIVLRLECTVCKHKNQLALKRCKHFELGGDKKTKLMVGCWQNAPADISCWATSPQSDSNPWDVANANEVACTSLEGSAPSSELNLEKLPTSKSNCQRRIASSPGPSRANKNCISSFLSRTAKSERNDDTVTEILQESPNTKLMVKDTFVNYSVLERPTCDGLHWNHHSKRGSFITNSSEHTARANAQGYLAHEYGDPRMLDNRYYATIQNGRDCDQIIHNNRPKADISLKIASDRTESHCFSSRARSFKDPSTYRGVSNQRVPALYHGNSPAHDGNFVCSRSKSSTPCNGELKAITANSTADVDGGGLDYVSAAHDFDLFAPIPSSRHLSNSKPDNFEPYTRVKPDHVSSRRNRDKTGQHPTRTDSFHTRERAIIQDSEKFIGSFRSENRSESPLCRIKPHDSDLSRGTKRKREGPFDNIENTRFNCAEPKDNSLWGMQEMKDKKPVDFFSTDFSSSVNLMKTSNPVDEFVLLEGKKSKSKFGWNVLDGNNSSDSTDLRQADCQMSLPQPSGSKTFLSDDWGAADSHSSWGAADSHSSWGADLKQTSGHSRKSKFHSIKDDKENLARDLPSSKRVDTLKQKSSWSSISDRSNMTVLTGLSNEKENVSNMAPESELASKLAKSHDASKNAVSGWGESDNIPGWGEPIDNIPGWEEFRETLQNTPKPSKSTSTPTKSMLLPSQADFGGKVNCSEHIFPSSKPIASSSGLSPKRLLKLEKLTSQFLKLISKVMETGSRASIKDCGDPVLEELFFEASLKAIETKGLNKHLVDPFYDKLHLLYLINEIFIAQSEAFGGVLAFNLTARCSFISVIAKRIFHIAFDEAASSRDAKLVLVKLLILWRQQRHFGPYFLESLFSLDEDHMRENLLQQAQEETFLPQRDIPLLQDDLFD
ncbi:40s ribosomal protein L44e [Mitosporidium daphniae]